MSDDKAIKKDKLLFLTWGRRPFTMTAKVNYSELSGIALFPVRKHRFVVILSYRYLNNTDYWVGKSHSENLFGFSGGEDEGNR
jgi:hypothetical protein